MLAPSVQRAADMPLYVVLNPAADRAGARRAAQVIEAALRSGERTYRVMHPKRAKVLSQTVAEAIGLAQQTGGAVIAAGGDGTVNAVAAAAWEAQVPMGIIPRGTFNYFARTHGVPIDIEAATKALVDAIPTPVQVGLLNDRPFLVNASIGAYPLLLERQEEYKQRYGRKRVIAILATAWSLLREHRDWGIDVELTGAHGQSLHTRTLFVGNNRLQFDTLGIAEAGEVECGRLVGIAMPEVRTGAMLGLLLRSAFGRLGQSAAIRTFCFHRLTVRPMSPKRNRALKVGMDGEVRVVRPPITICIAPRPLMLLLPPPQNTTA